MKIQLPVHETAQLPIATMMYVIYLNILAYVQKIATHLVHCVSQIQCVISEKDQIHAMIVLVTHVSTIFVSLTNTKEFVPTVCWTKVIVRMASVKSTKILWCVRMTAAFRFVEMDFAQTANTKESVQKIVSSMHYVGTNCAILMKIVLYVPQIAALRFVVMVFAPMLKIGLHVHEIAFSLLLAGMDSVGFKKTWLIVVKIVIEVLAKMAFVKQMNIRESAEELIVFLTLVETVH